MRGPKALWKIIVFTCINTTGAGGTKCKVEMATAQRTRPRAVVGAPRRAAWQLKSALRHSISAAPRTKIFLPFFLQLLLVIFSL